MIKIVAPLAFSAGALSVMLLSSAPERASADISVPTQQQAQPMPSLAPMLKQAMPAVVNISVTSKVEIQNPLLQDPFFRRFFNAPDQPQEREAQAIGSGVIVDAKNGYIITNNHVVDQADSIKVTLQDQREFDAKLIGHDPETDVAVLQIKGDNLTALPIADSDSLQVGDYVVAIGSPFGLQQTVTSGIVSALGRQTGISQDGYEDFIQTDASINPGNSGGALVNLRGELVGIPSNILSRSGGNIGIGFAIPINMAKTVMSQLIQYGEVQRGRIGVIGQPLTPELAKAFGMKDTRGALVAEVVDGSPADKAGLKAEDVIIKANGKEIQDFMELRNMVGLMRIGEKVKLEVLRDGKTRDFTVEVAKGDDVATSDSVHPALDGASFASASDSAGTKGVIVTDVDPTSAAARNGLRPNDIIIAVNREAVDDLADFNKKIAASKGELLLHIRRGNGALFLLIR